LWEHDARIGHFERAGGCGGFQAESALHGLASSGLWLRVRLFPFDMGDAIFELGEITCQLLQLFGDLYFEAEIFFFNRGMEADLQWTIGRTVPMKLFPALAIVLSTESLIPPFLIEQITTIETTFSWINFLRVNFWFYLSFSLQRLGIRRR
jgi:hypothetical protein